MVADIDLKAAVSVVAAVESAIGGKAMAVELDVTSEDSARAALDTVLEGLGKIDGLINNAAVNPTMAAADGAEWSRLESLPLEVWRHDLDVGLTGAFVCGKVFGANMAAAGGGAIVNMASDLALIGPDQRIYRRDGLPPDRQPVKPASYSVVKGGLVALTRYLATYWAEAGVRVNALCPGGVYDGQPDQFVQRLTNLIPMGRMAERGEYKAAIVFLCSDASAYMTGACLVMDGGRTAW